ncbi:MAG: hypothetical protein ACRC28_06435 [Clostridium sp.]|uniref:hypothetical protein n=1 Tax=Clostridium sp. TaxID=1506 RepID=UPI003F31FA3A
MDVNKVLGYIGKEVFVKYYYEFKSGRGAQYLPTKFTEKSRASRASKAKYLFNNGLNKEALEIIIESGRLDFAIRKKAREILEKEK